MGALFPFRLLDTVDLKKLGPRLHLVPWGLGALRGADERAGLLRSSSYDLKSIALSLAREFHHWQCPVNIVNPEGTFVLPVTSPKLFIPLTRV